jgi:hypothetical protein
MEQKDYITYPSPQILNNMTSILEIHCPGNVEMYHTSLLTLIIKLHSRTQKVNFV